MLPPGAGGSSDETPAGAEAPERRSRGRTGRIRPFARSPPPASAEAPAALGGAGTASSSPPRPPTTCGKDGRMKRSSWLGQEEVKFWKFLVF